MDLPHKADLSPSGDPLIPTGPDVLGWHEFAKLLNVTSSHFHHLRHNDVTFPISTRLRIGAVWSGKDVRAYDTARRRQGIYYPGPEADAK